MATANPFDLLGDDDNDDPSQLIAAQQRKMATKKPAAPSPAAAATPAVAKLPTKPAPPAQSVREAREARNNAAPGRGGAGRGGQGRGRGGRGGGMVPNRDFGNENSYGGGGGGGGGEDGYADRLQERERPPHQPFSGGRRGGYGGRGGYGNEESGGDSERPSRRLYERRSGTGRGYEMKRHGAGHGNWGTVAYETLAQEKDEVVNTDDKTLATEKQQEQEKIPSSTEESKENREGAPNEAEEKEEDKEMTLEEYERIREEKRKALLAMKTEERKVEIDKDLQSMQQLSTKKGNDLVFVKLGSDKDSGKKKEDRDERNKKSLSISEFLKPAEGERYYSPGGRGRGRGRGDRRPFRGSYGSGGSSFMAAAPSIEDPGQFPTLGGK